MELNNKLVSTVVMLSVVIICTAAILMPVLSTTTESFYTTEEYSNKSGDYQTSLSPITSETSNTLDISADGIVTNNGDIEYWADTTYSNVMLLTDTIFVFAMGDGTISITTSGGATTATSFSAVVSAGEITYSVDEADSVSTTYVAGYIADPTGDYLSCPASNTRYFDSANYAQTRYDSAYYAYIDGVGYKNGTVATMTVSSSEVDGTDGTVSTLTKITYSGSKGLTSICVMEKAATYTYTDNPGAVSLVGAIAPMVITGIVATAAGALVIRRD